MSAVYRKEMRQYFHSVIGYVFLAIFLFINAFYFLLQNLLTRSGDITDYFQATITLEMWIGASWVTMPPDEAPRSGVEFATCFLILLTPETRTLSRVG